MKMATLLDAPLWVHCFALVVAGTFFGLVVLMSCYWVLR